MIVTLTRTREFLSLVLILLLTAGLGLLPVQAILAAEKETKFLTLEGALRIALEKNKDIQKAREYRNLVEGRYVEERSAALPRLQFSGNIVHSRDESQKAYGFLAH